MSRRVKQASFLHVLLNSLFQRRPSNASISVGRQPTLLQRPSAGDDRASWETIDRKWANLGAPNQKLIYNGKNIFYYSWSSSVFDCNWQL